MGGGGTNGQLLEDTGGTLDRGGLEGEHRVVTLLESNYN